MVRVCGGEHAKKYTFQSASALKCALICPYAVGQSQLPAGPHSRAVHDGLIRIFQAYGFEVVEAVDNGPSLVRALEAHRPDVAVVDVRLPQTFTDEGLRAAIDARARIPARGR